MKKIQSIADISSISLSALCTIHCLVLPLLIVAMPNIAALQLDNENFHLAMVIFVIPISLYALTAGCNKHKRYHFLALGVLGILCLVSALFLGEELEKPMTVLGSVLIALSHIINYRLCKKSHESEQQAACHECC